MRTATRIAAPAVIFVAVFALWWAVSASSTSLFFPPLQQIVEAFADNWLSELLFTQAIPSFIRVVVGLLVAIVVGVAVGAIIGLARRSEPYVRPELEFLRALPPILIIPPLLLILGTGEVMEITVIVIASIWPILLATTDGVRAVEPVRADMGRVFRLPWHARFRWVVLPTAMPQVWSGVRAAVPIAIVVMVAAEYYSSQNGIGNFISQTTTTFRLADMWSAILLLGVMGVVLNGIAAGIGHGLDRAFGEFGNSNDD